MGSCGHRDSPWRFLTADEGRTLEALCEQIIPADQTPGAAWAGVVNYIDRQLMRPFRKHRDAYRSGLAALDQTAQQVAGKRFAWRNFGNVHWAHNRGAADRQPADEPE